MNAHLVNMKFFFRNFYCVLFVLIWINGCAREVSCVPDRMAQMQMVKEKIFKNYDKFIRPTNGTNTTDVIMHYIPRQIIGLDEEHSLLSMDGFLSMNWFDPRLQWNLSDYDGWLQLPASQLWVPDITVYNSHSQQVNPAEEVHIAFSSTGTVYWFPPILTQTECPEISEAPYFKQEVECMIQLGSWSTDGWEIDFFHGDTLWLNVFQNINPSWELITEKARAVKNVTFYECCPEPYLSIHIYLPMRRRPVPAIEATRAPCILVMILTLCIFWLPSDSSKKLLIGGILFLILNILLVYVGFSLGAPLAVVAAVSFVQTAMYLVVVTILLQVFIVFQLSSMAGPSRPPPVITHFLTGPFGKYACLRSPMSEDTLTLDRMQLKEDTSTAESFTARDEWKLLATAIDRVLFVVMSVVMLSVHHL